MAKKQIKPTTAKTLRECGYYVESVRAFKHVDTKQGKIRMDVYADGRWRVSLAGGLIDGNQEAETALAAMAANECAWTLRDKLNQE